MNFTNCVFVHNMVLMEKAMKAIGYSNSQIKKMKAENGVARDERHVVLATTIGAYLFLVKLAVKAELNVEIDFSSEETWNKIPEKAYALLKDT